MGSIKSTPFYSKFNEATAILRPAILIGVDTLSKSYILQDASTSLRNVTCLEKIIADFAMPIAPPLYSHE